MRPDGETGSQTPARIGGLERWRPLLRRLRAWASRYFLPKTGGPLRIGLTGRALSYVRSYLALRIGVGLIGILLPIVLMVCGGAFIDGGMDLRGALSEYYHSGMRDVFVGSLYVVAGFLIVYKIAELRTFESHISLLAGVCAFVVASFPMKMKGAPETPLQRSLTPETVGGVHDGAAITLIGLLTVMSILFAIDEGRRTQMEGRRSPSFWRAYHAFFAFLMAAACVYLIFKIATNDVPINKYALLIGESVAIMSFGASWLAKGFEPQVLFHEPPPAAVDGGGQPGEAPTPRPVVGE